ncbi:MAG: hypothetical protein ACMUIA_02325 [bacterium]
MKGGRSRFLGAGRFGATFSIMAIGFFLFFSSYGLTMAEDYSTYYSPYLPSSSYSFGSYFFGQNFSTPTPYSSLYFTPSYHTSSPYSYGQTASPQMSYTSSYSYSPSPYPFGQIFSPQTSPSFTFPYSDGMAYSPGIFQSAPFFVPPFFFYSPSMPAYGGLGPMIGSTYGSYGLSPGLYGAYPVSGGGQAGGIDSAGGYYGSSGAMYGYGGSFGSTYGYSYDGYYGAYFCSPVSIGGGVWPWPVFSPPGGQTGGGGSISGSTEPYEIKGKGRILDSGGKGITGLIVRIKGSERKTFTVNILDGSGQLEGGHYFFHDVAVSLEGLKLEIVSPDNNQILATRPVTGLAPCELTLIPDIYLDLSATSSVYSKRLKQLNLPDDLSPDGDYDGDRLSNREEILLYLTHPGLITLPLLLTGGLNLFYFPSVVDSLNMIPDDPNSHQLCSHNPFTGCWGKEDLLKRGRFNAFYAGSPAVLFVNLRSDNQRPVLCLRGFGDRAFDQKTMNGLMKIMIRDLFDLEPDDFEFDQQIMADLLNVIIQDLYGLDPSDFEPGESYLPSRMTDLLNKLIRHLFDPACFEPDASTLAVLDHDTFKKVHLINSLNLGHGQWESSYRFFGKSAGDEMRVTSDRVYTLMKGKEE